MVNIFFITEFLPIASSSNLDCGPSGELMTIWTLSFSISSTILGLPSPTLNISSQGILFFKRYWQVPFVAIKLNPSLFKSSAISTNPFLSESLTDKKAVPFSGTVYPSDFIAFKNALPAILSIPITSPVDFISGPKKTFSSLNFLNGNTAFFTATCL